MEAIENLREFTSALLENYFDSLREIGNRQYHVSASLTPHDKFKEIKRRKEIKESIKQTNALLDSFSAEHTSHVETFWDYVSELKLQEVEAKKVLDEQFIKFQNRAWQIIKMLQRRAEDRLDEFEEFSIENEQEVKQQLLLLCDLTFETMRDSWITKVNPLEEDSVT